MDKIKPSFTYFFAVTMALIFVGLLGWNNLNEANWWFDEACQFWTAYGMNSLAVPFHPSGPMINVWTGNFNGNLDPPLFTFLTRAWMQLSSGPIFLRILPYLFFVATFLGLIYLAKRLGPRGLLPVVGLTPLLSSDLLSWSLVLRAYSLWTFCVVFCLCMGVYLCQQSGPPKKQVQIILGIACGLCLFSRYSMGVFLFCTVLSLALINYRFRWQDFFSKYRYLLIPILFFTFIFFYFFYLHHAAHGSRIVPEYTKEFHLKHWADLVKLLCSPWVWPTLLFILCSFFKKTPRELKFLALLSVLVWVIYLALAFFRFHPLSLESRFNLDLIILSAASLLGLLVIIKNYFPTTHQIPLNLLCALLALTLFDQARNFRRQPYSQAYEQTVLFFQHHPQEKLHIDSTLSCELRFLFEVGRLKNSPHYPGQVILLDDSSSGDRSLGKALSKATKAFYFLGSIYSIDRLEKLVTDKQKLSTKQNGRHTLLVEVDQNFWATSLANSKIR